MSNGVKVLVFDNNHKLVDLCMSTEQLRPYQEKQYCWVDISNTTDPLHAMLKLQEQFQTRLGQMPVAEEDKAQYVMNNILYAEAEGHEFLREIEGFKSWKTYSWTQEEKDQHQAAALEEFVDMLHFIWNVAIAMGFSSEAIFGAYVEKNLVNHHRQDVGY